MGIYYPNVFSSIIVLGVFATAAVILRFWSRRKVSARLGWDDWTALLALVFLWADDTVLLHGAAVGTVSLEPEAMSPEKLKTSLKEIYICLAFMSLSMTAARLSVLFLYHRLFAINQRFALAIKIVGAASLVWFLGTFFVFIFRCVPVQAAWDTSITDGKCIDLSAVFTTTETLNCFLNLIVAVMPIPIIMKLLLRVEEKFYIGMILLAGGFVCVTSAMRVLVTFHLNGPDSAYFPSCFWLTLQLAFSVICACLPTYRPLAPAGMAIVPRVHKLLSSASSSWRGSRSGAAGASSSSRRSRSWPMSSAHSNESHKSASWLERGEKGHNNTAVTVEVEETITQKSEMRASTMELDDEWKNGVVVKTNIDVSR